MAIVENEVSYLQALNKLKILKAKSEGLMLTSEIEQMEDLKKSIEIFEKVYYRSRKLKPPMR